MQVRLIYSTHLVSMETVNVHKLCFTESHRRGAAVPREVLVYTSAESLAHPAEQVTVLPFDKQVSRTRQMVPPRWCLSLWRVAVLSEYSRRRIARRDGIGLLTGSGNARKPLLVPIDQVSQCRDLLL